MIQVFIPRGGTGPVRPGGPAKAGLPGRPFGRGRRHPRRRHGTAGNPGLGLRRGLLRVHRPGRARVHALPPAAPARRARAGVRLVSGRDGESVRVPRRDARPPDRAGRAGGARPGGVRPRVRERCAPSARPGGTGAVAPATGDFRGARACGPGGCDRGGCDAARPRTDRSDAIWPARGRGHGGQGARQRLRRPGGTPARAHPVVGSRTGP